MADASGIVLRAWDEGHNTQPDKPTWNVMGMLNNPWFKIKVHHLSLKSGQRVIKFEHPTLAGAQNGGWMERLRNHKALTAPALYYEPVDKENVSNLPDLFSLSGPINEPAPVAMVTKRIIDPTKPSYSLEQVNVIIIS